MPTLRQSLSDASFLSGVLYGVVVLLAVAALLYGQFGVALLLILLAGFLVARAYR